MPPDAQQSLEDILLQQGVIKSEQLSAIKLENINTGQSIEKIIRQHNFATEDQIVQARSEQIGVPYIKLDSLAFSAEALNLIPEPVARRYKLIPLAKEGESLLVAMADPLDLQVIQFIEKKSGMKVKRFLALESDVLKAIGEQYSQNLTVEVVSALKEVADVSGPEKSEYDEKEVIREAPVANIITQFLEYAIKTRASDIHIEPEETQTRVRYRIDGILHEKVILPKKVHEAVISRIKILSGLKIDERRLPQDGRFTFEYAGKQVDLRVSSLPTVFGEKAVLRLLAKSDQPPSLIELGLGGSALKNLATQLLRPHGIILICGPTGSGKTTTLYSILSKLSTSRVNILTIEDPVEYQIAGANQVQVNPTIGLTFASALRSFLRQDPNIILVGEIRDTETAELAIQASLTGHQVFSTLHTNSASGALPRLLDMGMEPFLLASAINATIGQRILRKLCIHCKIPYSPPPEVTESISHQLGSLMPKGPVQLYQAKGCSECGNLGYQGRMGIFEVLMVSDKIMRLILERASSVEIERQAIEEGMITLKQDGFLKVLRGITTLEEVLRVAQD
ncbi:Flp pilus assembly complex ATPase component TadA [Candidatus Daviesbacteria bacterium]|nr:Flp pilus assembly complex ATPase component TadA [Candidatus Daviesbacteria bacterium]